MGGNLSQERLGATNYSTSGDLMKVIEYNNNGNIIVEFQDEYKYKTKTEWRAFTLGTINNPYHPYICGVGRVGAKYRSIDIDNKGKNKKSKEYTVWQNMIRRCFNDKGRHTAYIGVTCCQEWLLFETFYEWLHNQENFEVWKNQERFCLDKDILVKGNKIYSPNTCCLVPERVNLIFTKRSKTKNTMNLPVGVKYISDATNNHYCAACNHSVIGYYPTPEEAFQIYKQHKEAYIKQVAQEEYDKGTISKKCYEAMMRWEVEITD